MAVRTKPQPRTGLAMFGALTGISALAALLLAQ
jgi:hypothetical protein